METFRPIVHSSPITEFDTELLSPMVVPLPIALNAPMLAEGDKLMSERSSILLLHQPLDGKR